MVSDIILSYFFLVKIKLKVDLTQEFFLLYTPFLEAPLSHRMSRCIDLLSVLANSPTETSKTVTNTTVDFIKCSH